MSEKNNEQIVADYNYGQFDEIINIVESAKIRAYKKVNEELILIYFEIGKYVSEKKAKSHHMDLIM